MQDFICPSILSADFARLGEHVSEALEGGADMVHFDVMDNHYVPNLSFGPLVCKALREYGIQAPIDVHLMVEPVDRLIDNFIEAGASWITFHPQASEDAAASIARIKQGSCKAGLALNPEHSLEQVETFINDIDMLLIMSVNPGFGGQSFIPETLDQLRAARAIIDASGGSTRLEVDGGIKLDNIAEVKAAGADTFVAGSEIFGAQDCRAMISDMRRALGAV